MESQDIDLEEAVGSYLNCLSQGCAAGSTLYKCIGKIIDKKFDEIFHQEAHDDVESLVQSCYQSLQMQNAFEDYQKALLACKEKLLEILIDSHTKKQNIYKNRRKQSTSEQGYLEIALQVAKELHCYHHTVAEVLKPIFISDFPEDFENATLKNINGKDEIVASWISIVEANRQLRDGYGLTNQELAYILSWQHGEDVAETHRKKINNRINSIIQQYVDQVCLYGVCEFDIPIAFDLYTEELPKILQKCCSPGEAYAATSIHIPKQKDEIELILNRELSRVCLCFNGHYYEKASAGKAFENTTQKLRALRESISALVDSKKMTATKEQIDMFCLRMLSTCSLSVSGASSRIATVMAFGKYNLLQVKPYNPDGERIMYINIDKDFLEIIIPSKWSITEDNALLSPLCRENNLVAIAVVNVTYHVIVNVEDYLVKRIDPIPVAHITKCLLKKSPSADIKKENERSKSIKKKLIIKASTKLFNKKSSKDIGEPDIITNENVYENIDTDKTAVKKEEKPIPPPRLKKKAKKSKLETEAGKDGISKEEKKEDLGWFSSSTKFSLPPVPTIAGSKDQSPSVASFEELQGVIDFLSGSSSSSLALNEKNEKLRHPFKTHKRNNSTTSLQTENKEVEKSIVEGKKKLCHRRSASFSGNSATDSKENEETTTEEEKTKNIEQLKRMSAELDKNIDNEKLLNDCPINDDEYICEGEIPFAERTPGDGMDNRLDKSTFASSPNLITKKSSNNDKNTKDKLKDDASLNQNEDVNNIVVNSQAAKQTSTTSQIVSNTDIKPHTKLHETRSFAASTIELQSNLNKSLEKETAKSEPDSIHMIGAIKQENQHLPTIPFKRDNQAFSPIQPTSSQVLPQTEPTFNYVLPSMRPPLNQALPSTQQALKENQMSQVLPFQKPNHALPGLPIQKQDQGLTTLPYQKENQSISLHQSNEILTHKEGLIGKEFHPAMTERYDAVSKPLFQGGTEPTVGKASNESTFYEPFSSKVSWSVDIGQKFGAWSDSSMDGEKPTATAQQPIATSERVMKTANDQKPPEFTLDKQQDLQKLLEGSKYMMNQQQLNWKDRSNILQGFETNSFDDNLDMYQNHGNSYERGSSTSSSSMDPWPLQSNNRSHHHSHYNNSSNHQPYQYNRHNINSLQLPPNPMGPYMRQNREQLLAKQQILEQYARQQKQLQIQQQQQQQQLLQQHYQHQYGGRFNNNNNSNSSSSSNFLGYGGSTYRQNSPSSSNYQIDRSGSVPPGLSSVDRAFSMATTSPRYDGTFGDHALYQRGLNVNSGMQRSYSQRSSNQSSPFGSASLSSSSSPLPSQSRSVTDLRIENNNFLGQQSLSNDTAAATSFSQCTNDQGLGYSTGRFPQSSNLTQSSTSSDTFNKLY